MLEAVSSPSAAQERVSLRPGLAVTRLGFGCSRLHHLSRREGEAMIGAALDLGLRYFDAAPAYGHGLAERILGRRLAEAGAADVVVATKWGLPTAAAWVDLAPTPMMRPAALSAIASRKALGAPAPLLLRPEAMRASVEGSLRRLARPRIDILWMHEPDVARLPDPDGLMRAFERLIAAGDVGWIGVAGFAEASYPVLEALSAADPLLQCDEASWRPERPPEVAFGALSQGPQSWKASGIDAETAAARLRAAAARRPDGALLVSTTKPAHLQALVAAL
ncbi:MAG: aldo/keto reductase [Pseudomonadota bacterium]